MFEDVWQAKYQHILKQWYLQRYRVLMSPLERSLIKIVSVPNKEPAFRHTQAGPALPSTPHLLAFFFLLEKHLKLIMKQMGVENATWRQLYKYILDVCFAFQFANEKYKGGAACQRGPPVSPGYPFQMLARLPGARLMALGLGAWVSSSRCDASCWSPTHFLALSQHSTVDQPPPQPADPNLRSMRPNFRGRSGSRIRVTCSCLLTLAFFCSENEDPGTEK